MEAKDYADNEDGNALLIADLHGTPTDFKNAVRALGRSGRLYDVMREYGVLVDGNTGTSHTKKIGQLAAILHGDKNKNKYLAAIFTQGDT